MAATTATTDLRAELKAWERSFKDVHARAPTFDDIRLDPIIAPKYKLYQKSKQARPHASRPPPRFLIPPRHVQPVETSHAPPSKAILPKSQPVPSQGPLPVSNPFSPVKNTTRSRSSHHDFTDPFESLSDSVHALLSNDEFSKARKRLRGEPVSPSPKGNEKKRRLASHAISKVDIFQRTDAYDDSEEDTDTKDRTATGHVPSPPFITDTPVKATRDTRSFMTLFESSAQDTRVTSAAALPHAPLSRSTKSSTRLLLQDAGESSGLMSDSRGDSSLVFTKSTNKRGVAALDDVIPEHENPSDGQSTRFSSLIPPSPPQEASLRHSNKNKRQNRAPLRQNKRLKRDRLGNDQREEASESGSDDDQVKDLGWFSPSKNALDPGADHQASEALMTSRKYTHEQLPSEQLRDDIPHGEGDLFVDLPDELQRLLAVSLPRHRPVLPDELVQTLIRGGRDPRYKGEIWDAGERADDRITDEEDWEGEGLPWEIGEL